MIQFHKKILHHLLICLILVIKLKLKGGKLGIVRYIGTAKFAKGTVIGLEVEKWEPNGYNVTVKGRTYFSTPPGRGYFLQH